MKEDNEQLKEKLSVASRSLNSANKEHEERGTCTIHVYMYMYSTYEHAIMILWYVYSI